MSASDDDVRPWASKYLTRSQPGVMAPTALGLAADAKFDAALDALFPGQNGGTP